MGKKLYVGNLSYNATGSDLEQLFSQHGQVSSTEVIADRDDLLARDEVELGRDGGDLSALGD